MTFPFEHIFKSIITLSKSNLIFYCFLSHDLNFKRTFTACREKINCQTKYPCSQPTMKMLFPLSFPPSPLILIILNLNENILWIWIYYVCHDIFFTCSFSLTLQHDCNTGKHAHNISFQPFSHPMSVCCYTKLHFILKFHASIHLFSQFTISGRVVGGRILTHLLHWFQSKATIVRLSCWIPNHEQLRLWILSSPRSPACWLSLKNLSCSSFLQHSVCSIGAVTSQAVFPSFGERILLSAVEVICLRTSTSTAN